MTVQRDSDRLRLLQEVRESLRALAVPASFKSVLIGPYEQLTGAAYSLLVADGHGAWDRSTKRYYTEVQRTEDSFILSYTQEGRMEGRIRDWLSGFYFNCAVERIVFGAERLLKTVASVRCTCGD